MKICLISEVFPNSVKVGGVGTTIVTLAKGLAKRNYEVYIITRKPPKVNLYKFPENLDIHVYNAQIDFNNKFLNFAYFHFPFGIFRKIMIKIFPKFWDVVEWNIAAYLKFKSLSKANKFSLVHTPEYYMGGLFIALFEQIPVYVRVHTWTLLIQKTDFFSGFKLLQYRLINWMENLYIKKSDGFFAVSKYIADFTQQRLKLDSPPQVIYNCVDTSMFYKKKSLNKKRKQLIYVGRLQKNKGVELLLSAFVKLSKQYPEWNIIFVGKDYINFKNLISNLQITDIIKSRIIVKDNVLPKRLIHFYNSSSIGIFPTYFDGCGLTVLEAMACGLPVIVSKKNGIVELIKNESEGLVIEPEENDLISAMKQLMDDHALRKSMGNNALEKAKQYNIKNITNQIIDFYKSKSVKEF
jgi:glycosyltransferase involved in cell wall biosynthesis